MKPELQLILGCFGLGMVLTYAWWARLRVDVLRIQLAGVLGRLDEMESLQGTVGNPGHLWARCCINKMIRGAPFFTSAITLFLGQSKVPRPPGTRTIWEMLGERPIVAGVIPPEMATIERDAVWEAFFILIIFSSLGSISGLCHVVRRLSFSNLRIILGLLGIVVTGKMHSEVNKFQQAAIKRLVGAYLL